MVEKMAGLFTWKSDTPTDIPPCIVIAGQHDWTINGTT